MKKGIAVLGILCLLTVFGNPAMVTGGVIPSSGKFDYIIVDRPDWREDRIIEYVSRVNLTEIYFDTPEKHHAEFLLNGITVKHLSREESQIDEETEWVEERNAMDRENPYELRIYGTFDGSFEISAPDGYIFVPENTEGYSNLDKSLFNTEEAKEVLDIQLSDGLRWTKGDSPTGSGTVGEDFSFYHRYSGNKIFPSTVIIELKGIEKMREYSGTMVINGLKLVAVEKVPEGDIILQVKCRSGYPVNEGKFIGGVKVKEEIRTEEVKKDIPSLDTANRENIIGREIMPVKGANIYNYSLKELTVMKEYQQRSYIFVNSGSGIQPENNVTRGEVAHMIYSLLGDENKVYSQTLIYENENLRNPIEFCVERGYIKGYVDGTFGPEKEITRAEISVILNNILQPEGKYETELIEQEHWAYESVAALTGKGIISGYPDGTFKPDNFVTKQESVVMLNKAFGRESGFKNGSVDFHDLTPEMWSYEYMMNAAYGID